MKKRQMDILLRFWDSGKDCTQTRYMDSSFLSSFTLTSKVLDPTKSLQVLSDGPNVNLAFLDLIIDKRKEMEYSQLIHTRTYGFHALHNAFSHSAKARSWKLKELLSALYKILDEFPSR